MSKPNYVTSMRLAERLYCHVREYIRAVEIGTAYEQALALSRLRGSVRAIDSHDKVHSPAVYETHRTLFPLAGME